MVTAKYASTVNINSRFPGVWHCRYWYPSNTHPGEDLSEYLARIEQKGNGYVLHSLPNKMEAYMLARFTVDGDVVTGTWLEDTSVYGEFKGMVYSGAFQLLMREDGKRMDGRWVGIGHEDGHPNIYHGRWEIEYAGDSASDDDSDRIE